jgi:hypothetical protein
LYRYTSECEVEKYEEGMRKENVASVGAPYKLNPVDPQLERRLVFNP